MEPYKQGLIPNHWKYGKINPIKGRIIVVSGLRIIHRNLDLIFPRTRSLKKYDIVEISVINTENICKGNKINDLLYIGFFEVLEGGQAIVNENITINGVNIGKIFGFSDIHYPNHLNIILKSKKWHDKTVQESLKVFNSNSYIYNLNINIGDEIIIKYE